VISPHEHRDHDSVIADKIPEEHQRVRGVIITFEDVLRIKWALKVAPNIDFYRYKVRFDLIKA